MPIPSLEAWMAETHAGPFKPRSAQLKAVDKAIQQYETARSESNLWAIKNAFEDWKRATPAWTTSDRNGKGAVTRLDQELGTLASQAGHRAREFTLQEQLALQIVLRERRKVISTVFRGKEVTFRNPTNPKAVRDALKDAAENVKARSALALDSVRGLNKKSTQTPADMARKKLEEIVKSAFQVSTLESLGSLSGTILDVVGKCGVSVTPVVGYVKDGYDLFTGWARVADSLHRQYSISDRSYMIDTGSPAAAFEGVKTCLRDQARNDATSATIATTSFGLKTGLAFVDGGAASGPIVGALNAVASLSLQIYWLATEWKATKAINEALAADRLDLSLFRTYPLMGCYLMTSATLSDLIPISSFGTPGWMDYVENLKKRQFDGIYESATRLIDNSPWEIKGLPKRPAAGAGMNLGRITSPIKELGGNIKGIFGG